MATRTTREMKDMAKRFERYSATAERQRKLQAEREERERKRQLEKEMREKKKKEEEKDLWIQAIEFSGFSDAHAGDFRLLAGILIVGMKQIGIYGKSGEEMYIDEFNRRVAKLNGEEEEEPKEEQPEEQQPAQGGAAPAVPVSTVETQEKVKEQPAEEEDGVVKQMNGEDEEGEYIG